jgi:hypothetical protein
MSLKFLSVASSSVKAGAASPFSLVKTNGSSVLSSSDDKDLWRESLTESPSITACAPITGLAFSPRHPEILAVASHVDGWQPAAHGIEGGVQGLQVVQRIGSREGRSVHPDRSSDQVPSSRPRVTIWNIKSMSASLFERIFFAKLIRTAQLT